MPQGKILPVKPALADASVSFGNEPIASNSEPASNSEVEATANHSLDSSATAPDRNSEEEPRE